MSVNNAKSFTIWLDMKFEGQFEKLLLVTKSRSWPNAIKGKFSEKCLEVCYLLRQQQWIQALNGDSLNISKDPSQKESFYLIPWSEDFSRRKSWKSKHNRRWRKVNWMENQTIDLEWDLKSSICIPFKAPPFCWVVVSPLSFSVFFDR